MSAVMIQLCVWRCLVHWVFPKDVMVDNVTAKHFFEDIFKMLISLSKLFV